MVNTLPSLVSIARTALFGLLFAVLPLTARAETARLTYQVYAGGIHVVEANLDLDLQSKSYAAALTSFTRGFLGTLVPWRGSFETAGTRSGNALRVKKHRSVSTWKGSDDVAVYAYDTKGNFQSLKLTDDGKDKTPKNIDPALTKGTTDILTATLGMMLTTGTASKCEAQADIFDSRRRFTLKYAAQGDETLKPSKYTLYAGPAYKCTAEVIPAGGNWHKKPRGWLSIQEQGRKKGTMPTLWLAKINPDLPPVPVKIMIKTDYGTLFMHLAKAVDKAGKPLYTP